MMNGMFKYLAFCILMVLTANTLAAQSISASGTTAASSNIKIGNLSYSYMIGQMGSCIIKPNNTIEKENSRKEDTKPSITRDISITAYPNPFVEELKVSFTYDADAPQPRLQVIDNTGRIIVPECTYSTGDGKCEFTIAGNQLPQGKYIIRIITNGIALTTGAVKI